jgi:hypothetical protein
MTHTLDPAEKLQMVEAELEEVRKTLGRLERLEAVLLRMREQLFATPSPRNQAHD